MILGGRSVLHQGLKSKENVKCMIKPELMLNVFDNIEGGSNIDLKYNASVAYKLRRVKNILCVENPHIVWK